MKYNLTKKAVYLTTKLSQVVFSKFRVSSKSSRQIRIVYYPAFDSYLELADQINRLKWYVPNSEGLEVWVALKDNLLDIELGNLPLPTYQRKSPQGHKPNIKFCSLQKLDGILSNSNVVCVWKTDIVNWKNILPHWTRVRIIDPNYYHLTEAITYPGLYWYDILDPSEKANLNINSAKLLKELFTKYGGADKTYLFGTGPSSKYIEDYNYSDGIRIICNSMVRNDKLLEHIRPQILTFTDCVFHFGVSKYAGEFANDVMKTVENYGCYCITNQVGYALLLAHYPELKNNLIGVPAIRFGRANALTPDFIRTRDYSNILTRYMLPLAVGLSLKTILIGFDGRKPGLNYFWKHNPDIQYVDIMDTPKIAHPSFFKDMDYDEYDTSHRKILENMLSVFEKKGHTFEVRTQSYIPALRKRYKSNQVSELITQLNNGDA